MVRNPLFAHSASKLQVPAGYDANINLHFLELSKKIVINTERSLAAHWIEEKKHGQTTASRFRDSTDQSPSSSTNHTTNAHDAHQSRIKIQTRTAPLSQSLPATKDTERNKLAAQSAQSTDKFYRRTSGNKSRKNLSDSELQPKNFAPHHPHQDAFSKPNHPQCWPGG